MRIILSIAFLLFLCAPTIPAQTTSAAGTWDTTLVSPQGTYNVQLILKQDGEKVTGVAKGPRGEFPVDGTIKGKDLKVKYTINFQGTDMVIALTGAVDGSAIKGTADYGGLATGEFSSKLASDAAASTAKTPVADKIDISGAWNFQVESPNGSGTPTFTFKQDGEKLSGQYKGLFGEAPLTGTLKDNKVEFAIKVDVQGQQETITYTGTVEKDGSMKGTAQVGQIGSATWTAKRQ